MRIPKYKAYVKELDKIFDVNEIAFLSHDIVIVVDYEYKEYSFDEVELMQYIGLKDKNGVEIYEGDILQLKNKNYEVVFNDYEYTLKGFWNSGYDEPGSAFSEGTTMYERIGNIYQNKELLEKEK